jgi:hypothetical protein
VPTTLKPDQQAERDAARQARIEMANQAVIDLGAQPVWERWMRLRAGLYTFSWGNQCLLALQLAQRGIDRPGPIQSGTRWKKVGYHPAKGSKALYVWAPHTFRDRDDLDATGQPKRKLYFKLVPEFASIDVRSFDDGQPPEAPPASSRSKATTSAAST